MPAAMSFIALPRAILRLSIAICCDVGIACSTVLCDRSLPDLAPRVSLQELHLYASVASFCIYITFQKPKDDRLYNASLCEQASLRAQIEERTYILQ